MYEAKGMINIYRCERCGLNTITVNRDEGVTPFMILCKVHGPDTRCRGMAISMMYPKEAQNLVPAYEWYRPTTTELEKEEQPVKDHVDNGGLILRRLESSDLAKYGYLEVNTNE